MKPECVECLHRQKKRLLKDGRTWTFCDIGYTMEQTGVRCNCQRYKEKRGN